MQGIEEKRQIAPHYLLAMSGQKEDKNLKSCSMKNIWGADNHKVESSYEKEHTGISSRQL